MSKRAADEGDIGVTTTKKAKQDADTEGLAPDSQLRKDDQGNYYLDLGDLKRATVSTFKGKAQLDIREYYTDKTTGDIKPGKKGITLNPSQWSTLSSAVSILTEKLEIAHAADTEESSKSKKPTTEKPARKKRKKTKEESKAQASGED